MPWVVDTSVLLDVHLNDPLFGLCSARCLAQHLEDGLVVCPVSFIELAPAFGGDAALQERFLQEAGVDWLEPWIWQDTEAGHGWWGLHIANKRRGRSTKRPVADIMIEAFAQRFQGLITRNPKDFSAVETVCPT